MPYYVTVQQRVDWMLIGYGRQFNLQRLDANLTFYVDWWSCKSTFLKTVQYLVHKSFSHNYKLTSEDIDG